MNEVGLPALTKAASVQEATKFIDQSMRKTAEQILETGYGFYILKEACEKEEEDFVSLAEDRYKLSKSAISKWVKIGSKYRELFQHRNILPTSYSTIYSLLTLPKAAFKEVVEEGYLHPSLSFEEAEQIKKAYQADKKAKKEVKQGEELDSNPFSEENLEKFEEDQKSDLDSEEEQLPFSEKSKLNDPLEGEFTEVKEKPKKKKKLTVLEALEVLDIDLDDAFMMAKKAGSYTDEELLEAIAILRGE